MKRIPSVKELRQRGFKVHVIHELDYCTYSKHDNTLLTRGRTFVNISPPNTSTLSCHCAYCSIKDQYNKKMGVRIALGRSIKGLEKVGYEI